MKKNFKLVLISILVLAMFFATFGCQKPVETKGTDDPKETPATTEPTETEVPPVKIAILYNVSGMGADSGKLEVNACKFMADYINANGGIKSLGGAKIELVIGDTMSDTAQAKAIAERVLANPEILAVSAATGSNYLIPMLPVFDRLEIPVTCINISDTITQSGYKYVTQAVCRGTQFGLTQIEFLEYLEQKYGVEISKIAILYENSEYGETTAQGSRDKMASYGDKYEIVFDESFPVGLTDASSLITAMKNTGAQVLLPVAFSQDAKLIYSTMASMDYDPISLGGGAGFLFPAFAEMMGDSVNGYLSTSMCNFDTYAFTKNEEFSKFPAMYEEQYGEFPTEHFCAPANTIYLIAQAMETAGVRDRDAINNALHAFEGPSLIQTKDGITRFDENGWNSGTEALMVQWQKDPDGKYRTRTVYPEYFSDSEFQVPKIIQDMIDNG